MPAPPPRETHLFSFPAQKLILNTTLHCTALHCNPGSLDVQELLLVLPDLSLGIEVPSLVLTGKPIITSWILLRFSTVETFYNPPVALDLVHVSDGLHPVLLLGHAGPILGVV